MDLQTITGKVVTANTHGLKLDGESDWRNFSKFAKPEAIHTPVVAGSTVRLGLDKSGYVRSLEPVTVAVPQPTAAPQQAPAAAPIAGGQDAAPQGEAPDRETVICRLACLKAAATVAQGHADTRVVIELAAAFEAWVYRPA